MGNLKGEGGAQAYISKVSVQSLDDQQLVPIGVDQSSRAAVLRDEALVGGSVELGGKAVLSQNSDQRRGHGVLFWVVPLGSLWEQTP